MSKKSYAYQTLCTHYYDVDKPYAPPDALEFYLEKAKEQGGTVLEPMCGTGRFLIPFLKKGINVIGFDNSVSMLKICLEKCRLENLPLNRAISSDFETFCPSTHFSMIFIPSGSFCLLTSEESVHLALKQVHSWLGKKGRFYFEVDTLHSAVKEQGVWKGSWVDTDEGGKILLSSCATFSRELMVQQGVNKYELWENNRIIQTEVETFDLKLYTPARIEKLLKQHGFYIVNKTKPYLETEATDSDLSIVYECSKT